MYMQRTLSTGKKLEMFRKRKEIEYVQIQNLLKKWVMPCTSRLQRRNFELLEDLQVKEEIVNVQNIQRIRNKWEMSRRSSGQGVNCKCLEDIEDREEIVHVQKMQRIGKKMERSRRCRGQGRIWKYLEDLEDREETGIVQKIQGIGKKLEISRKSRRSRGYQWGPNHKPGLTSAGLRPPRIRETRGCPQPPPNSRHLKNR